MLGKKEKALNVRMYTDKEIIERLNKVLADMVAETAKDKDSGQGSLIELLVGTKFIATVEKKMKAGEF